MEITYHDLRNAVSGCHGSEMEHGCWVSATYLVCYVSCCYSNVLQSEKTDIMLVAVADFQFGPHPLKVDMCIHHWASIEFPFKVFSAMVRILVLQYCLAMKHNYLLSCFNMRCSQPLWLVARK